MVVEELVEHMKGVRDRWDGVLPTRSECVGVCVCWGGVQVRSTWIVCHLSRVVVVLKGGEGG